MKLTRNNQLEKELLDEIDASMFDGDRHQPSVSGMIYCLTKTFYENEMVMDNPDGTSGVKHSPEQTLLFITGLGLEATLLKRRQISEAGETEGIQWHLDHYGEDGKFMEVKSTRQNSKNSEKISEGWNKQILAYFYAKGITEGDLTILHLMGAYNPPFPQLYCWHLESTTDEVNANWAWIQSRADIYRDAVSSGIPPTPFKHNMEWECKNCNWKGLCDAKTTLSQLQSREL